MHRTPRAKSDLGDAHGVLHQKKRMFLKDMRTGWNRYALKNILKHLKIISFRWESKNWGTTISGNSLGSFKNGNGLVANVHKTKKDNSP